VSEVVTDDTDVIDRTTRLQRAGRNVNVSTTALMPDRESVPTMASLTLGMPPGYSYDAGLRW
jgi:hypothetical protein